MTVLCEESGLRVDSFLASALEELSRSQLQKLLEEGHVRLNGRPVKKNAKTTAGESYEVDVPEPREIGILPEDIPLDIVYEDSDVIVINKPKGLVVHPAAGHWSGTLVNALMFHCRDLSGINGALRPGIVHRIDMDTSGLLIVAKNDFAHQKLAAQLKDHTLARTYEAIVCGNLREDSGTIDAPIGRHPLERKKMAVIRDGHTSRHAVTHYFVLDRYQGYTHAKVRLETGRTHQIRVHMSYIGHPVAGDPVYGPKKVIQSLQGQCLHAGKIGFIHPRSGEYMEIDSELPAYFQDFLHKLKGVNE